jgi:hypothetical protein
MVHILFNGREYIFKVCWMKSKMVFFLFIIFKYFPYIYIALAGQFQPNVHTQKDRLSRKLMELRKGHSAKSAHVWCNAVLRKQDWPFLVKTIAFTSKAKNCSSYGVHMERFPSSKRVHLILWLEFQTKLFSRRGDHYRLKNSPPKRGTQFSGILAKISDGNYVMLSHVDACIYRLPGAVLYSPIESFSTIF